MSTINKSYYENMNLEQLKKIYNSMTEELEDCYIGNDGCTIYKRYVKDMFVEHKYIREATEFEKTIYAIYWKRVLG